MPKSDDPQVAALLRERQGYVQRELPERVAQVDAELDRLGYVDEKSARRAAKKTAAPPDRSTRGGRQATA